MDSEGVGALLGALGRNRERWEGCGVFIGPGALGGVRGIHRALLGALGRNGTYTGPSWGAGGGNEAHTRP